MFVVKRPVYSLARFETQFPDFRPPRLPFLVESHKHLKRTIRSREDWRRRLENSIPLVFKLRQFYQWKFLLWDIVAGLTMAMFYIPQGMAYGKVAGLKPINGLYSAFFIPLVYAIFGTSRQISVGTFAIMCLMMAGPVERMAKTLHNGTTPPEPFSPNETALEDQFRVQVAIVVTLISGLVQVIMGLFHLGFLATYFSDALVNGFSSGAAFHVLAAQWANIFGFTIGTHTGVFKLIHIYADLFHNMSRINWGSFIISLVCIAILLLFKEVINPRVKKRFKCPVPIEIILLVVTTLLQKWCHFHEKFGVPIVGDVPQGLPPPSVPNVGKFFLDVFPDACAMAVVGFAVSASLCKLFCLRFHYSVDFNQELLAMGLANCFGSFFSCHTGAGGLARSMVVADVGMKSQIATLFSSGVIFTVLMWIGPFFADVPNCVLSAIICVALKELLFKVSDTPKMWRISSFDLLVWVVSFVSTVLLDVLPGLLIGFIVSLMTIIFRSQHPAARTLGRIPGTELYMDLQENPQAREVDHVKIFRFDSSLYFANVAYFERTLWEALGLSEEDVLLAGDNAEGGVKSPENHAAEVSLGSDGGHITSVDDREAIISEEVQNSSVNSTSCRSSPWHSVVLDCSSWAYLDCVGVRALHNVTQVLRRRGIRLCLAVCKTNVKEMFLRCNFFTPLPGTVGLTKDDVFLTVHDAVLTVTTSSELEMDSSLVGTSSSVIS